MTKRPVESGNNSGGWEPVGGSKLAGQGSTIRENWYDDDDDKYDDDNVNDDDDDDVIMSRSEQSTCGK